MSTKGKVAFDPIRAWEIAGLAFMWPCLQSSGFYPLSVVPSIASMGAAEVALFHLCYSVELIVAFVVMIALRRRLEVLLRSSRVVPAIAGLLGVIGHVLLIACDAASPSSGILIMAAMPLVATFEAAFVLLWGCRFSGGDSGGAVLGIAVSFAASQLVLVFVCGGFSFYAPFLLACTVCTAMCAVLSARAAPSSHVFGLSSLRQLPWRTTALMMLLVYFCVIYVRLRIPEFSGDASMSSKLRIPPVPVHLLRGSALPSTERESRERACRGVHQQAHRAYAGAVLFHDVGDHDVVERGHAVLIEDLAEHFATVGDGVLVAFEIVMIDIAVNPVLGVGGAVVGLDPAPLPQAIERFLRLLAPCVLPVQIREAIAAVAHVLIPGVHIGVQFGIVVGRAAGPCGKPAIAGGALFGEDDALARLRGGVGGVQAG